MAVNQQLASVRCPVCQNPMTVPVESIIDAQQRPDLKVRFLQGQMNMFQCQKCGNVIGLTTPILYHDGNKQLLFCLTPANTSLKGTDTQKMIGSLTNALMNSLPAERRKAYLFQPKMFLTPESMVEAILEADGITKEMIEAQKAKVALIDQLLQANADADKLKSLVAQNETMLDQEFFQMLSTLIAAARTEPQQKAAQDLMGLYRKLLPLTSIGREILEAEKKYHEEIVATKDELLRRLASAKDEAEVEALVRAGRPYMDYAFFQEFTDKIDAAPAKEAARLTKRREQILAIAEKQDEETKKALMERTELLKRLLQTNDLEPLLRESLPLLDEAFFTILSANLQQATQVGQRDAVQKLQQIGDNAMRLVRENAPPAIKLVNQLMETESVEETQRLLKENLEQIGPEFFQMVDALAGELDEMGQAEASQRLQEIIQQAGALVGGK